MLRKLTRLQFALVATLACVGCATQQTKSAQSNQTFQSIDTNGDGTLSQQELQTWLDSNNDGSISEDEWNRLMIDPADD